MAEGDRQDWVNETGWLKDNQFASLFIGEVSPAS
ncbi:MAG: hypothetical protein JWP81_1668 [Ferruginibacter sp.]|nr:hypothetical protein [Ferruginibacter sp.]